MLDYDDLDALEGYALATGTQERRQLLAASAPGASGVTAGQVFLAGLHALERGDLAAAKDQVQRLKSIAPHSDHFPRLEALVALRSWPSDPAATCSYLEGSLGLSFHAATPAAAGGPGEQSPQPPQLPQLAGADLAAPAPAPRLSSSLDASLHSDEAILQKAVRLSRGPTRRTQAENELRAKELAALLSSAGRAAALSYGEEFNLDLSLDERLQLTGAGSLGNGARSWKAIVHALAGSAQLVQLAKEAALAQRGGVVEHLLSYISAQQLDEQVATLPPAAAASPALLSAAVRKMYGTQGAAASGVAAADASMGASVSSTNRTPELTPAEASAIRHRVLELCARLRRGSGADGEEVAPERLAWLEARALLPLTEAAAWDATTAAAAATTAAEAGAVDGTAVTAAEKATTAAALLGRLLSAVAVNVLLGRGFNNPVLAASASRAGAPLPPPPTDNLGPALPPLSPNVSIVIRRLLVTVLHVSPDPPALFAAGGALAGALEPSLQAWLLAETMLTRGSATAPSAASAGVDWTLAYRDTGGDLTALAEAVELDVSGPDGVVQAGWQAPGDEVVLTVTHKGAKRISVLVYDIATEAYYRQQGSEVGMGVDLEGLGATFQIEIKLPAGLSSLQRCRRLVPLPQLTGRRGVWVVEVQGGGRHSRALVRRGNLAAVTRPCAAGLAMTLFREDGTPVPDPRVWVDGRMYGATTAVAGPREVMVPYRATGTATVPAVLVDGDGAGAGRAFASLISLRHTTEDYELTCGMHLELESAAAGGRGGVAPLLLQPCLTIGGWSAPLELLQDLTLTVKADDLEGANGGGSGSGARSQVFQDWSAGNGLQAAVVQVRLPDRPGRVTAVLTARLKRVAPGTDGEAAYQVFREERTWNLNDSDSEQQELRDLHLTRGDGGRYLLRLLGRAGEPHPGVQVVVALTHAFSAAAAPPQEATESAPPVGDDNGDGANGTTLIVRQALITDANGTIDLGQLSGITAVAAGVDASGGAVRVDYQSGRRRRYCWRLPSVLTGSCNPDRHAGEQEDSAGAFGTELRLRTLAAGSDGSNVQFCIPCAGLALGMELAAPAAESAQLRRRLGLVLVSVAAGATAAMPGLPGGNADDKTFETSEVMDERHVAIHQGCIQVSGLAAGVYRFFVTRLGIAATLFVYNSPVIGPAPPVPNVSVTDGAGPATQSERPGGFVLSGGLVAPLSEAQPLQIVELGANASGGVTARLEGSEHQLAAAVVHVVLSRFEPHFGAPGNPAPVGRRWLLAGPGSAFGCTTPGAYQSGRRQGDEVRYVLERRRLVAEGRVRPMPALVDRPSLLVEPWKVRETTTAVRAAERGEGFAIGCAAGGGLGRPHLGASLASLCGDDMMCGSAMMDASMFRMYGGGGTKDVSTLGLAFCPPSVLLANVPVGADGVVRLAPEQLAAAVAAAVGPAGVPMSSSDPWVAAGHRVVRLIAYTAPAGVPASVFGSHAYCEARTAVEGAPAPSWSDPRVTTALQRPFPAGSACLERRSCHALQPGADLVVADAATAKLQLYATVQKVWALYGSLLSLAPFNPLMPPKAADSDDARLWGEFSSVGSWATLSSPAKVQCYSQLACRELAFFCYCHDPEFFQAIVLPYMRLRLPSSRCCLDAWLAGVRGSQLVEVWGAPHRYGTLTPLERILLTWEEDLMAAGDGPRPPVLTRLARLAADMRTRVKRRSWAMGAGAAAEAKRRRFELALNGPGQGDDDAGQLKGGDLERVMGTAFHGVEVGMAAPQFRGSANPGAAWHIAAAAHGAAMGYARMPLATNSADVALRQVQTAAPPYRPAPATQEWAEAGWFRRSPTAKLDPDTISPESEFWADLAEHLSKGGRLGSGSGSGSAFLPRSLESGGWSFSDALLATAVVGVSWEEAHPLSVAHGTRLTLTASSPTIAYVRQTAALPASELAAGSAVAAPGPAGTSSRGLLILQRLLDPSLDPSDVPRRGSGGADAADGDDDDEEPEQQHSSGGVEVSPGSPLTYGRTYCYSITVTNTGASSMRMDVTVQAPEGAVALGGRPALWIRSTELQPYGAAHLPLYYFYFPRDGAEGGGGGGGADELHDAFPAAAAARERVLAVAFGQSTKLQVLPSLPPPPAVDLSSTAVSWSRLVTLPATPEADAARLRYLAEGDLSAADLSLVLWRCRDAAFWREAVAALRRRHVWSERLWSYAVLHRDEEALRELLPAQGRLKGLLGQEAPAAGPLFTAAPGTAGDIDATAMSADRHPHLEYWPLVNARAHPLGARRDLLNEAVDASWRRLLRRMAALAASGREAGLEDLLAAAYYLVLQDRPAEASAILERIQARATPPGSGSSDAADLGCDVELQLVYLRAWLTLADPVAEAPELKAAAATVRQWCQPDAAGGAAAAGGGQLPLYKVYEPKWQARLASIAAALEDAAAAAGGAHASSALAAAGVAAGAGDGATGGKSAPLVLLYDSPDGPRGAIVLEVAEMAKVALSAHFMDLELLFSAAPFDTTLLGSHARNGRTGGGGGQGKFSLLRPSWSTTLDLPDIAAAANEGRAPVAIRVLMAPSGNSSSSSPYKLLIQPHLLVQQQEDPTAAAAGVGTSGAMLLEAVTVGFKTAGAGGAGAGGHQRSSLACYRCDLRVAVLKEQGVVVVTNTETGAPVAGAYVKAYVASDGAGGAASFHKDGYSDRRGLMDFWTLTSKPGAKVRSVALLVSHPDLGSAVLHTEPPLQ